MVNPSYQQLNVYNDLCPCNSGKKIIDCCFAEINTTPPGHKTGYSNPNCYARSLQDCSRTISKEHYISRGILDLLGDGTFQASGVSWLKNSESQKLSKNVLAAKVLCQRHNEALSGLDSIAQKFFRFVLGKTKDQWAMIIKGYEIERWMLKAYCGLVSSGVITHKLIPSPKSTPSLDFLSTLFYRKEIPSGRGLFFNDNILGPERGVIGWRPLIHEKYGLAGFLIKVDFFEMALSFGNIGDYENEAKSKGFHFHPESICINDHFGYREIHFGWPEGGNIFLSETKNP